MSIEEDKNHSWNLCNTETDFSNAGKVTQRLSNCVELSAKSLAKDSPGMPLRASTKKSLRDLGHRFLSFEYLFWNIGAAEQRVEWQRNNLGHRYFT